MFKFLLFWLLPLTSFYSLSYSDIDGNTVSMSQFQDKKVLLVNIASSSSRVSQLASLQQFHQLHGDSVIVIAFPSNSFGNEPLSNSQIKTFCQTNYNTTFRIAGKIDVQGLSIHPVYYWLTDLSRNGAMGSPIGNDFQKFLVDKDGSLIGVFAPSLDPMSSTILSAIQ